MQKLAPKSSSSPHRTVVKLSNTCASCQARHLKCCGATPCIRCAKDRLNCFYRTCRRGQRATQQRQQTSPCPSPGPRADFPPQPIASKTCESCRNRHLRCSGPPTCTRCVEKGTVCHFRASRRGQRQADRSAKGADTVRRVQSPTAPSSPCVVPGQDASLWPRLVFAQETTDPKSARSFRYFRERTCYDLCRPQDREFWTSLVLCISHDQPAIKQILIALGSLHESLEIAYSSWGDKEDQPLNLFSLEKYRAAIKHLKTDGSDLSIEIVLISCVLLVYFETLHNDHRSAMNLMQSGLRLLPQWRAQSQVKDQIVRIFDRIRQQALTFFAEAAIQSDPPLAQHPSRNHPELSATSLSFSNLAHAKACFDGITEEAYRVMNPVLCTADYPLTFKVLVGFRAVLDRWYARFNNFVVRDGRNDVSSRKRLVFLRIQYRVASLLTAASPASGQIRYDKNLEDFRGIMSDVALLLDLRDDKPCRYSAEKKGGEVGKDTHAPPFRDLQKHSVIPALLVCAFFCRSPLLRRQAITLLSAQDWRDASWTQFAAEKAATWISATDEHEAKNPRTRADVPQSCRIRLLETVRLGQNLPALAHQEAEAEEADKSRPPKATVPLARGYVRIDLAFALESQRVLLRYLGVLRALAGPVEGGGEGVAGQ